MMLHFGALSLEYGKTKDLKLLHIIIGHMVCYLLVL